MTDRHLLRGALVLATATTLLAGCGAGPERTAAAGSPYPSISSGTTTDPAPSAISPSRRRPPPAATNHPGIPTLTRPTGPPREPTDQLKKTDIVVGTVTRGGSGPCYGLQTDDGVDYALYSAGGQQLTRGTRVKVQTRPTRLRIDCGAGRFVEIAAILS
jgi:hypothetical protein